MTDLKIGIVLGSTRQSRIGGFVADWVLEQAQGRDAQYEIVDLRDYPMPLFDAPASPAWVPSSDEGVQKFTAKIAEFDGYVFVTPEYNHATSAVLKNALDSVYNEWTNKAAAFAGYGSVGGTRAVENLRLIASELQLAHVRTQFAFSIFTDFTGFATPDIAFTPGPQHAVSAEALFGQLETWAGALKSVRESAAA